MLLDPETLDLLPRAAEVVDAAGDERFKLEMPAAQLELTLPPARTRPRGDRGARARAAATSRPPPRRSAGSPPPACTRSRDPVGELNDGRALRADRGRVRRRSRGASSSARSRSTSRSAARTARSPSTTACAPGCRSSPRSPPTRRSTTAATPAWRRSARRSASSCRARGSRRRSRRGRRSPRRSPGAPPRARCPTPRRWWWELRPHPAFGTLEVRVPDAQATVADAAAVAALVHALAAWLARATTPASRSRPPTRGGWRRTAGRRRAAAWTPSWPTCARASARRRASAWPRCSTSSRRSPPSLGCAAELATVERLAAHGGAARQREVAAAGGGVARRGRVACRRLRARARVRRRVRREDRRRMSELPGRARPHHRGAAGRPARAAAPPAADRAARRRRPARRRGPPARALPLLRAALPRPARRRRALGVVALAAGAAPGARAALRGRAARGGRAGRPGAGRRRSSTSRCARSTRPTTAPSLSRHLEREATLEQVLEFLVHRSAYQLKEADPHSWAIPRLSGPPKAALVEIQADEYGGGRPERMHAELFARRDGGARARLPLRRVPRPPAGGDARDGQPDVALGLHRRLRGAIVGHLALFEMTSSIPNRRYGERAAPARLRRRAATEFFDEHVAADAVHEEIAAVDLAGGLARSEPALAGGHPLGRRARWPRSRRAGRARCSAPGRRAAARCAVRSSGAGAGPEAVPLVAAAPGLGAARRLEPHQLVRAVAERAQARLAAAAQRDRLAPRVDRVAVLVEDAERRRARAAARRGRG